MVIIPIVTLDKIFIKPDNENIYFLDCTRVDGTDEIVARRSESLDNQIERLAKTLNKKDIILADDVVFSGGVLRNIIARFNKLGVNVVGIIASICSEDGYNYFNSNLKYGIKANYLMGNEVIDQVCERDFYFGIAGSGIMVNDNGKLKKAPYFKPYGNPCERASIPEEYEGRFSVECLLRSICLWEEIDKLKPKETKILELPEEIINTDKEDRVVKTLRKELKRVWREYK